MQLYIGLHPEMLNTTSEIYVYMDLMEHMRCSAEAIRELRSLTSESHGACVR